MACPLFLPASPLARFSEGSPLGDLYAGECAAGPMVLSDDTLRLCCNVGYARETCARAAQTDADAFRFLIKADRSGVVEVAWSSERNHHPVAVGCVQVDSREPGRSEAAGGPLEQQARAYAAAYRRQTGH